jgi:hypothetical protein
MSELSSKNAEWEAEYEFWNKIITGEVARLRWNGGFEPLECDLYRDGREWIGKTRICHRDFRVTATETFDGGGKRILRLAIGLAARLH